MPFRPHNQTTILQQSIGAKRYLGTISLSTVTRDNGDATSFTITPGTLLWLQPTVACRVNSGSAATVTATATSVLIPAGDEGDGYPWLMPETDSYLAAILDSGTGSLLVYECV